jgi:hypothetical protein
VPDRALVLPRSSPWVVAAGLLLAVLLAAGQLTVSAANPAHADVPSRREQVRFMWAMAGQESGWDYYARNESSGAFGKYQIMPANWPAWAAQYLGDRRADQTPWNQERVAYGKLRDLYGWLGSWKRVAYWWLTGDTEANERRWSGYAMGYVKTIMELRRRAPRDGGPMPARTASQPVRGDWRRAVGTSHLHLGVSGRSWTRRGVIDDGQVVRVHHATTKPNGVRWLAILTRDGRLGWLPQSSTLPAERPHRAARWHDVRVRGGDAEPPDRHLTRPRPR